MVTAVKKPAPCRSANPANCKFHGVPKSTKPLAPTPEIYKQIPQDFNLDNEKFDETKYIGNCTEYLNQLDKEEITSVNQYVQADYNYINSALYGNTPATAKIKNQIRLLDAALTKAPEAPPVLWRSLSGFELPNKFREQNHQLGDVLEFKGYTSTSETPSALMHIPNDLTWYMRETPDDEWEHDPKMTYKVVLPKGYEDQPAKNVFFMIKTRTAAPVSVLRGTTAEQEWLIPRGKKFRITNIHENKTVSGYHMRNGTRATIYEVEEI